MIRALAFALALIAATVYGPGVAYAQTSGTVAYSGLAAINKIILGTPGVTAIATGGNATVSAAAAETVTVASTGLEIPVMVTASSAVTAARLGGLLANAMKMGTVIGAATVIVPMIASQTGITVCAPPQFFCKPDPKGPAPADVLGHWTQSNAMGNGGCKSASDNCTMLQAAGEYCVAMYGAAYRTPTYPYDANQPSYSTSNKQWSYYNFCKSANGMNEPLHNVVQNDVATCPDGYYLSKGECVANGATIPLVDMPASDISNALQTPLQTQANMQNAMDTARLSNVALLDSTSPVTVSAPPVTSQPQTKTETVANPDGTTSTKVTTSTSTITPTITGSTVGDTKITYPTTTTVTTTTTNNTTNVSTTTSYTINEYATPQTPNKVDLPSDYNREATQRRIEADLTTDGAASLPDQGAVITKAQNNSDTQLGQMRTDAQNNMPSSQSAWYSFVWTPPVGQCTPYDLTVAGSYHGTVNFCSTVDNIRSVLGWLMALFSAFTVWKLLFKREA